MNLNYLKCFQTLANLEHYGRASEELGIAQSSLSHAIASLEQELGIPLFEKKGRNSTLTHQGSQYLSYVDSALLLLEEGQRMIKKADNGSISVGFVSSVRPFLMNKIKSFKINSPYKNCRFMLYEETTDSLLEELKKGKLDFLLASSANNDACFISKPIIRQKLLVIQSSKKNVISEKKISVKELAKIPLVMHTQNSGVRKITDALFDIHHCRPIITGEASGDNVIVEMVSMGLGPAIVTESADIYREDIDIVELDDTENYRYIYLIIKKGRYMPPVLDAFIESIR